MPGSAAPDTDLSWYKSSFSEGAETCVEVARAGDGGRWLRDTKDRDRPAHYFTSAEWAAFVKGVKDGEFD
jgi:hypothetical protein